MEQAAYRYAKKRATDELEHDDAASPGTKKISMYGWDGSGKVRIKVAADGTLVGGGLTALEHQTAIACSSAITSAGLSTTAKTWMNLSNAGSKIAYLGGSAATTANGTKIFPNQNYIFGGCQSAFKVFFVSAVGDDSEIRVMER